MSYTSLGQIAKVIEELVFLIEDTIGEHGKAVMISIKSPRQIIVTKVNQIKEWDSSTDFSADSISELIWRRNLETLWVKFSSA